MKIDLDALYDDFKLKERKGHNNKIYKYVPSMDIIDRMNKVFGGKWGTQVIEHKVFSDQVLVLVRVSIYDDNGLNISHDGFASHRIVKGVDIGNTFKSAVSKAIRTACTRWGVALYLEDDTTTEDYSESNKSNDFFDQSFFNNSQTSIEQSSLPSVENKKNNPNNNNVLPTFPDDNIVGGKESESPLDNNDFSSFDDFFKSDNINNGADFSKNEANSSNDNLFATEVQKIAIQTLLENHKISLQELANKADINIGDNDIENIKYADAVVLIQKGNKLNG